MIDTNPFVATPQGTLKDNVGETRRENYTKANPNQPLIDFRDEETEKLKAWHKFYNESGEIFPITGDSPLTRAFRQGFAWGRLFGQQNT